MSISFFSFRLILVVWPGNLHCYFHPTADFCLLLLLYESEPEYWPHNSLILLSSTSAAIAAASSSSTSRSSLLRSQEPWSVGYIRGHSSYTPRLTPERDNSVQLSDENLFVRLTDSSLLFSLKARVSNSFCHSSPTWLGNPSDYFLYQWS